MQDINEALALDPANGDANALRAIIHIARNDKAAALESAAAATSSAPNNYRAWLALSYAQQASFELEQALESARKAQALEPNSSLVNARVAELLMSLGRIDEAEAAARAGVTANPAESRAHSMLGFVHLAQIDTRQARADFEAAIERDSFNPLARLGLGLAMIRDGKLVEGREQLEIAVALDPTNSLLRSYVGKAYYEENTKERDELAATQFGLAKQLDPNDPTPWFYEAILQQTQNQPVEALQDLHTSVLKNDNRAVYRSSLRVDDDNAARTASVAAVYADLGFEKLAILESTKAIAREPGKSLCPQVARYGVFESSQTRYCSGQRGAPGTDQAARIDLAVTARCSAPTTSLSSGMWVQHKRGQTNTTCYSVEMGRVWSLTGYQEAETR